MSNHKFVTINDIPTMKLKQLFNLLYPNYELSEQDKEIFKKFNPNIVVFSGLEYCYTQLFENYFTKQDQLQTFQSKIKSLLQDNIPEILNLTSSFDSFTILENIYVFNIIINILFINNYFKNLFTENNLEFNSKAKSLVYDQKIFLKCKEQQIELDSIPIQFEEIVQNYFYKINIINHKNLFNRMRFGDEMQTDITRSNIDDIDYDVAPRCCKSNLEQIYYSMKQIIESKDYEYGSWKTFICLYKIICIIFIQYGLKFRNDISSSIWSNIMFILYNLEQCMFFNYEMNKPKDEDNLKLIGEIENKYLKLIKLLLNSLYQTLNNSNNSKNSNDEFINEWFSLYKPSVDVKLIENIPLINELKDIVKRNTKELFQNDQLYNVLENIFNKDDLNENVQEKINYISLVQTILDNSFIDPDYLE